MNKMQTTTRQNSVILGFTLAILLLAVPALAQDGPALGDKTHGGDSGFPGYHDPVIDFLHSTAFRSLIEDESQPLEKALKKVHRFSHRFPIAPGQTLFVTEYFTTRSVLREPARAMILLTGPEFRGNFWDIPIESYNMPEMAARRGFFVYTLDYIGVGKSYLPEDGSLVNHITNVPPVRKLIDFVRRSRQVELVDLIGEGYGGQIAARLAPESERVRSVVMSTMFYKDLTAGALGFFSPGFEAFLRSQPNGYWHANFLNNTLRFSPNQELRDYVFATQQGVYPTGAVLEFWDIGLPFFDPTPAAVPLLAIHAQFDPFPAAGDMENLVADWGHDDATLLVIAGSFHVPRIEAEPIAAQYFEAVFSFIDP